MGALSVNTHAELQLLIYRLLLGRMNGASDFSWLLYLASAANGMAGGVVYVARQLMTKDDLKDAKVEIKELMDERFSKMEDKFEKRLDNIENWQLESQKEDIGQHKIIV